MAGKKDSLLENGTCSWCVAVWNDGFSWSKSILSSWVSQQQASRKAS